MSASLEKILFHRLVLIDVSEYETRSYYSIVIGKTRYEVLSETKMIWGILLTAMVLALLIESLFSFTMMPSIGRAIPTRKSSPLSTSSTDMRHLRLHRRLTPFSSKLLRPSKRSDFYDEDDSTYYSDDDDDVNYYENEKKEIDPDADYYSLELDYEEEETENDYNPIKKSRKLSSSSSNDNYYEDELSSSNSYDMDGSGSDGDRGGYYQVSFNEEVDPSETEIDWEVCTSSSSDGRRGGKTQSLVLLPPAAVERPNVIIHFVGGTFFGSNPKLWYRSLLENIVRSTSAAIIVTPIPVTIFKNPLQHIRLSQKLRASFEHAWFTVLEDEYGSDVLRDIPLCGLGHSLGSRLLTVLTTLNKNVPSRNERQGRESTTSIPPYKSMCLISFTNYDAKAGIPGVAALQKQSKKLYNKENKNGQRSHRRKSNRYFDGYDDSYEDEEWSELVEELQETVSEQANRIQTALTPDSKDLEFVPSPDRLWKAIREDARYNVNTTLLVQFDDDSIDQSSQLAQALHTTNSSDVRFARLRGNHLTPVSVADDDHDDNGDIKMGGARARRRLRQQTSAGKLGAVIEKTIKGNSKNRRDRIAMRDLRLSIVSYITDVVTK